MLNFVLGTAITIIEIAVTLLYLSKKNFFELNKLNWKQRAVVLAVSITSLLVNILLLGSGYSIYEKLNILTVYFLLLVLAGNDYHKHEIPNKLIIAGFAMRAITIMCEALVSFEGIVNNLIFSVIGLIVCFLFMLFLSFITRHGIGYGDVKMVAWLGFCVGVVDVYYIAFYGVLVAAIVGGILVLTKKLDKKAQIPFAPFIWVGCSIVYITTFIQG